MPGNGSKRGAKVIHKYPLKPGASKPKLPKRRINMKERMEAARIVRQRVARNRVKRRENSSSQSHVRKRWHWIFFAVAVLIAAVTMFPAFKPPIDEDISSGVGIEGFSEKMWSVTSLPSSHDLYAGSNANALPSDYETLISRLDDDVLLQLEAEMIERAEMRGEPLSLFFEMVQQEVKSRSVAMERDVDSKNVHSTTAHDNGGDIGIDGNSNMDFSAQEASASSMTWQGSLLEEERIPANIRVWLARDI